MSVRNALAWSFAGQAASFLAVFGTTVALSRILSPREIGAYAIGVAVTGVLQGLSAFGIGTYLVRHHDLSHSVKAAAFTLNALISLALCFAIMASSFLDAVTLREPQVAAILRLLALVPLIGIAEFMPATMLQREMRFAKISLITVLRTLASAIVSVGAALLGASALSSAYGALAFAIVGVLGFNIVASHHATVSLSMSGSRAITGFGLKTLSIGGLSILSMRLSDIILGRILGLTALGYYSRANSLSNILFQNVYGSAARVLLVKLAGDIRSTASMKDSYLRSLNIILAIMWPLLAGLAILSQPVVEIIFGERWLAAANPLSVLLVVQMLGLSFAMNHELFVLRDRVGEQVRLEMVRTVIGILFFAYGCTFGILGATVGRLADPIVGMIFYLPRLPRLSGASSRDIATVLLTNLGVTTVTVAPALVTMILASDQGEMYSVKLAVAIASSGILWIAALRFVNHPLYQEIRQIIQYIALKRLKWG